MKCVCCGSTAITNFQNDSFFKVPVLECQNCGYKYTNIQKQDVQNFLDNYYKETYWQGVHKSETILQKIVKIISWLRVEYIRADSQYEYLKDFKGKVLDIGAGEGAASIVFSRHGYQVTAVEPDAANARNLRTVKPSLLIHEGNFESIRLDQTFDIIIVSHVLEHSADIIAFLELAKKYMSYNGIMFIEVPTCENPKNLNNSTMLNPHISHFTRQSLESLLLLSGFTILKFDSVCPELEGSKLARGLKLIVYRVRKKNMYRKSTDQEGDAFRIIVTLLKKK